MEIFDKFLLFPKLEGRILVHGEEDTERQAGRSYLMLEGTDGQVHYIYYNAGDGRGAQSRRASGQFIR